MPLMLSKLYDVLLDILVNPKGTTKNGEGV